MELTPYDSIVQPLLDNHARSTKRMVNWPRPQFISEAGFSTPVPGGGPTCADAQNDAKTSEKVNNIWTPFFINFLF